MNEREKLIEDLRNSCPMLDERDGSQRPIYDEEMEVLVGFILEDRKRIVQPLVELKRLSDNEYGWAESWEAINETLKLAALDTLPEQKGE